MLALAVGTHLADAWTTATALDRDGFYEVNPFMRSIIGAFGKPGVYGVKLIYLGYLWLVTRHKHPTERESDYFLAALLGGAAATNNLGEMAYMGSLPALTPGVASVTDGSTVSGI